MEHTIDSRWVDDQIGYLLRRASANMAADYAAHPDEGPPLRPVQVSMLALIAANPGVAQGELGTTLGIQRTNIAPLVAQLVEAALVERRPSPTDGRRVELHLTADGERAWRVGRDRIERHEARATAPLGDADRARLRSLLRRLIP